MVGTEESECGHQCPDGVKVQLTIKKGEGPGSALPLGGGMRGFSY